MFEHARKIADAVLYEGYLLYPYRGSAHKNRMRWQFGVLAPRAWSKAGGCEPWSTQSECLIETGGAVSITGKLRFLQVQRRTLERALDPEGRAFEPVDTLDAGGALHTTWDEAVEREVDFDETLGPAPSCCDRAVHFAVPGGDERELLYHASGAVAGRALRRRRAVAGVVRLASRPVEGGIRLRVSVENLTACDEAPEDRDVALTRALAGAHSLLSVAGGEFVSLLDPPEWARAIVASLENVRSFPVLAGAGGRRDVILCSPIILYDHPAIAPESPGDWCDATEMDELLVLSTLALTDEEKREVRATDARAAAILDRAEAGPGALLSRLHGATRSSTARAEKRRVRLRPGPRSDAQDMFLDGRIAVVEAVEHDLEGVEYLAVSLADDGGALQHGYNRYLYFRPDEVEPLEPGACP